MTRACCPGCRLRFSRATAVHLRACPFCGEPLQSRSAVAVVGFRLMAMDGPGADVDVIAAALVPEGEPRRRPPSH